ncbi:MAG: sigma factor-like helix-turn-helix DNA-binding protein [Bacilli bacterium]
MEWDVLLDTLTASERRIVLDVVTHGYSERDLAERLGWTLSKVHRTKERALTKLRGMLNE